MKVKIIGYSSDISNNPLQDVSEYKDEYEVTEDMNTYWVIRNLRTNNTYYFNPIKLEVIED